MVTFSVGVCSCVSAQKNEMRGEWCLILLLRNVAAHPNIKQKGFAEHGCYGRGEFPTRIFEWFACHRAVERGAGLEKAACFCHPPEYHFDISHVGDGNIRHPQQEQEQGS